MKCTASDCNEKPTRVLAVRAQYSVGIGSINGYCAGCAASVLRMFPGSFDVTGGSSRGVLRVVLGTEA